MPAPVLTERNWSVLGLLRFVLAFNIVITHLCFAMGFRDWQRMFGGFVDVSGFFVISGFSIGASIAARPQGYLRRRIRRIYPLNFSAILLTVLVVAYTGPGETEFHNMVALPSLYESLLTALLFNGIVLATPFVFAPLWSLNCEIVYYFMAPFLTRFATPFLILLLLMSLMLFEHMLIFTHGATYNYAGMSNGLAIISLFWLWLLGFMAYRYPGNPWLIGFGVLGVGALLAHSAMTDGVMALPLFVSVVLAVTALPYIQLPRCLVRPANYLGELSYSLYVLHFPVVLLAWHGLAGRPPVVIIASIVTGSLVLAVAAYHGIDRQFRNPRRVRAE